MGDLLTNNKPPGLLKSDSPNEELKKSTMGQEASPPAELKDKTLNKQQDKEKPTVFDGVKFVKPKESGANDSGQYGGIYQDISSPNDLSMIKREKDHSKNISEFLGSQIVRLVSPGSAAEVTFIAPKYIIEKVSPGDRLQNNGQEIYVRSKFFKDYVDMQEDMVMHMSPETRPSNVGKINGRWVFMGTREIWSKTFTNAFEERKYQDFAKIAGPSLVIGDFDIHIGNIGVISPNSLAPRLVRIDFAASFEDMENDIHPHSILRHLPGWGPTNHFREFPSAIKYNHFFADQLLKMSKSNVTETLNKSIDQIYHYYNDEVVGQWAKKAMREPFKTVSPGQIKVQDVKKELNSVMQKRLISLGEYAIQIKLGLLIKDGAIERKGLQELMTQHPLYFDKIKNNEAQLKVRGESKDFVLTPQNFFEYVLQHFLPYKKQKIKNEMFKLINEISQNSNITPAEQAISQNNQPVILPEPPPTLKNFSKQGNLEEQLAAIKRDLKGFIPPPKKSAEELLTIIEELCDKIKEVPSIEGKEKLITQWLKDNKHNLDLPEKITVLRGVVSSPDLMPASNNITAPEVVSQQAGNESLPIAGNTRFKRFMFETISALHKERDNISISTNKKPKSIGISAVAGGIIK